MNRALDPDQHWPPKAGMCGYAYGSSASRTFMLLLRLPMPPSEDHSRFELW